MTRGSAPRRLAGVELGGTNAVVVLGDEHCIRERLRFPVTRPAETLGQLAECLAGWNREAPIDALGIASFGPIRIDPLAADHGRMLATPKPGWSGADVLGALGNSVPGPTVLQTDVTAAALAEGHAGAARGCRHHVYITVGTGVGAGIIADGRPLSGVLHPEVGHLRVRRLAGDAFAGACPFHGDCLEGLVSGPALAARTKRDPATLSADDPCWETMLDALAEACATLFLTLATERIVIGGGVLAQRAPLIAKIAERCGAKLGGYHPHPDRLSPIHPAALTDSGARGALLMAAAALSERSCGPIG